MKKQKTLTTFFIDGACRRQEGRTALFEQAAHPPPQKYNSGSTLLVWEHKKIKTRSITYPINRHSTIHTLQPLFHLIVIIHDGAFDLFDQVGYRDAAWAGVGAVEDGTTTPYAIALTQDNETFNNTLITTVKDETIRVDDRDWSNPVRVAPH